ncbi:MAG: DUF4316 domain-containing protein [Ruminococcus sp.]|nr:DUF4316 domain-containing protein [Ruminococcus sp.]
MDDRVYGVWAVRSGSSMFGHAEAWCKDHGKVIEFESKAEAEKYAAERNAETSLNCHYHVMSKQHDRDSIRYPIERTPDDKIPAVGRPAHLPENYLLNAELKEEAQTGNYNMLDGRMDNLAPESAAEKSSVIDKLKVDQPDQEPRQRTHRDKAREREI